MSDRESTYSELDKQISEKEKTRSELDKQISEKEKTCTDLDKQISEKEKTSLELDIKISEREKASSKSFWSTIRGTVYVCLIGVIICCFWFCYTSVRFSAVWSEVIQKIHSSVTLTNISDTPSAPLASPSLAPTLDPSSVPSSVPTSLPTSGTASEKNDDIDILIKHLENMVAIQKNGMTNDLMSFIYGILSAVLVGLCATFVEKSRNSADETKKTADKAQLLVNKATKETKDAITQAQKTTIEAKDNAEEAKKQAAIAKDKANATVKAINEAKNATEDAKKNADEAKVQAALAKEQADAAENAINDARKATEEAKRNAEEAKEQAARAEEKARDVQKAIEQAQNAAEIANVIKYQVKLFNISGRIVTAKAALLGLNNILATRAITTIRDEISFVCSDNEFRLINKSKEFDALELGKIYDELLDLDKNVEVFLDVCKERYKDEAFESMKKAVENYHKWILSSLDCIDACIRETQDPNE